MFLSFLNEGISKAACAASVVHTQGSLKHWQMNHFFLVGVQRFQTVSLKAKKYLTTLQTCCCYSRSPIQL